MPPIPLPTKLGLDRNCRNKTDFQNLPGAMTPIFGQ
jgi:hypothetical protein